MHAMKQSDLEKISELGFNQNHFVLDGFYGKGSLSEFFFPPIN